MRRVLMIAPQFPPSRAVAAKRPLHFARHLPQHGWEAAVVCLESTVLREPALEELIPPVPLYRGYRGGPFARLEDRRAQKKSARAQQSVYAAQHKRAQSKKGLMARFIQAFKRSFNIFDQYMKHLPWVRGPIEHFMREQQCEVIYATGGPFSALVLSAWLAKRSGLPLILDLRDPWSIEPNYRADRSRLGQWIIDYVEARCFQRAQKIILNTASAHSAYVETYRDRIPADRFTFIRNSFDPELYEARKEMGQTESPFTIAYFGNLRPTKNALLFLEAYRKWLDQRELSPEKCQIMMLGEVSSADHDKLNALSLIPYLQSATPVPFTQAPQVLGQVDLLLDLMGPHHHMQIGGKLYDYLACERPILSISPNQELDAIFEETKAGERVDLDVDAIVSAIDRAYVAKRDGLTFEPNREAVMKLSARQATIELVDCLNEVSI